MSQDVPIVEAERSHTGHQWECQSSMRAPPSYSLGQDPPSSSLGRAPTSADGNPAETTAAPQAAEATVAPAPQAAEDTAAPAPQAAEDTAAPAPQAPEDTAAPAPQAPEDTATPPLQTPEEHTPASPLLQHCGHQTTAIAVGQQPVDALYSPLGEEYITLQRRLIRSTESLQRGQKMFFRDQERFHRHSIELQRDIAALLSASVQNQSQMMQILSDMQMHMDNRWREQNQLLGVLDKHFTHQQDTASSLSSVASTPAETPESARTRRTRQLTTGPSAPSSKKPTNK
ncbi:uncharacterized protein LOC128662395 [Bombina bombina]|uniref:uncharacterized protein LOC128662395 n=1 Tax=Bombina bombina TaxID=8345 RepID=UPI00235AEFE7|nr:uncharacterized protein LOC128662395 [Bombina bombina]